MRYWLVVAALALPVSASAMTLSQAISKTCHERGLKSGTAKFKACQAEVIDRIGNLADASPPPDPVSPVAVGDGTPDDKECQSYGFQPGAQGYLVCRFQMKKLHADDERVAAARASMEATEAQMRALSAQEPPRPSEPSLSDRLLRANEAYWDERAKRAAQQSTTRCHTDYNGDVTCTTN